MKTLIPNPLKLEVFTYIFYKIFMDHNCESSIKIRSRIICYILECFAQTDFIGTFCVETLVPIPASQPMKILIALKRPAVWKGNCEPVQSLNPKTRTLNPKTSWPTPIRHAQKHSTNAEGVKRFCIDLCGRGASRGCGWFRRISVGEEDLAWDFLLWIADGENCFSLHSEVSHPFPSFFLFITFAVWGHFFCRWNLGFSSPKVFEIITSNTLIKSLESKADRTQFWANFFRQDVQQGRVDIFSQKRGMRTRVLSAVGLLLNSCKVCMPLTITWRSWWTLVFFPPPSTLTFVYCEQLLNAGGARAYAISSKPDEWWAIDGQIHRLRPPLYGDLHTIVNMEVPNPRPRPISARQRLAARNRLVSQIRIRDDSVHTLLSFLLPISFAELWPIQHNVGRRTCGEKTVFDLQYPNSRIFR